MSERPLVRIRILGQSEAPEIECRAMICATGNNIVVVGDMTRRTVLCRRDAGVERPEFREFAFDPIKTVLEDRGAYVAAAITIIRAYQAAGSPAVCPPIGSYGTWSSTVRSALVWLGEEDPVASMETLREEDPQLGSIRELFSQWREHFIEDAPYTSRDIAASAEARDYDGKIIRPDLHDLLLSMASNKAGKICKKRLGRRLSGVKGRVVDGRKLDVEADASHGNRFILRRVRDG
jgi:putative DNA primase/helicase